MARRKLPVISLFSGAMGLYLGLERVGFRVRVAVECSRFAEVAVHLGVARDSVYRWVEKKRLPAHRVGRHIRFKLSEVDAWVQAGGGANDGSGTNSAGATESDRG